MKSENFLVIQGWMRTELNLKGNDLLVYAIIYGFSQSENQKFTGSLQYLADWCGATKQGILKNLKNLLDNGLIEKTEVFNNGIKFVEYYTTELNGVLNKVERGVKQSLINNIEDNKTENKENTNSKELVQNSGFEFGKSKSTPKKESLYTKCIAMINDFTRDKQVISDLTIYLHILLEMRKDGYILYSNVWKGLLNKLKELSTDPEEQHKIISQSVERGYKSFFPVNGGIYYDIRKGKPWEEGVRSDRYTDEELKELAELNKQREAQGLRTKF